MYYVYDHNFDCIKFVHYYNIILEVKTIQIF